MKAVDPMAVAVAWLDAYRDAALEPLMALYDAAATVECACGGRKIVVGKPAIAAYWQQRFAEKPMLAVEDLRRDGDAVVALNRVGDGAVQAILDVDGAGRIRRVRCGQIRRIRTPAS